MARRFAVDGISENRVYKVQTAARLIGVSEPTFRKWSKVGLRIMSDKRPHLVRGADLIDFLQKRRAASKRIMAVDQFYCMRCKAPRHPLAGSLTYSPLNALTGRLSGLCDQCGANFGRFCKASDAPKPDEL